MGPGRGHARRDGARALRVLIVHAYSHRNKGDWCIAQTLVRAVRRHCPLSRVVVSSIDPADGGKYGEDEWVPGLHRRQLTAGSRLGGIAWALWTLAMTELAARAHRRVRHQLNTYVDACARADVIVACGGGYLYEKSALNLLLCLQTLRIPLLMAKPLGIAAQSIGPFRANGWRSRLTRHVLRRPGVRIIHVREQESWSLIKAWGLEGKTQLVPDLAFAFAEPRDGARQAGQRALGFTVRRWFRDRARQQRFESAFAEAVRHSAANCRRVVGFVQVDGPDLNDTDRASTERVLELLEGTSATRTLVVPETPAAMIDALAALDIFIGTRMHSNILALLAGVPVIAVAYQHKTTGIMQMLGRESYVVDANAIDPERVKRLVEQVLAQPSAYLSDVTDRIKEFAKASDEAVCSILSDLGGMVEPSAEGAL
jgi:colanic acid/amylovoran biosynthesis protein WcaK/AmsJ